MKTYKGVTYFDNRDQAESFVKKNVPFTYDWAKPNNGILIRSFVRGYAVQLCDSGPYFNQEINAFI